MLSVKALFCERDDRVLFRNLDFHLSGGQAIQVQGSNGSGKTTLLRILCGLNTDYTGDFFWHDQPMAKSWPQFRESVFYLGHAPAINKTLTAEENLRWYCASRGLKNDISISKALAFFGLQGYEEVPCYMMSAGQQRRVSLARLKLTNARLLVLDEPFTALDKRGVQELEAMLAGFVAEGGALILTTHHPLQLECPLQVIDLDKYNTEAEAQW